MNQRKSWVRKLRFVQERGPKAGNRNPWAQAAGYLINISFSCVFWCFFFLPQEGLAIIAWQCQKYFLVLLVWLSLCDWFPWEGCRVFRVVLNLFLCLQGCATVRTHGRHPTWDMVEDYTEANDANIEQCWDLLWFWCCFWALIHPVHDFRWLLKDPEPFASTVLPRKTCRLADCIASAFRLTTFGTWFIHLAPELALVHRDVWPTYPHRLLWLAIARCASSRTTRWFVEPSSFR